MTTATVCGSPSRVVHFEPGHRMTKKLREKLLCRAAVSSPAINIRNWRLVVIDDPEQRKRIREAAWDREQVTDAALLVILCADLKAWKDEPLHYWHTSSAPFREFNVPCGRQCFHGLDRAQRDAVMRAGGFAAQALASAAEAAGYTACPIDSLDLEAVADFIDLPDDFAVCLLVAIGKEAAGSRAAEAAPPLDDVVITDRF